MTDNLATQKDLAQEAINTRLGIGGNNPPDPLILEADERVGTANKWLTQRKEITDAEMADKASFFVTQIDATFKALDGQRLEEKRKFLAEQDAKYSGPLTLLTKAKVAIGDMRREWLKKEDARLAEERRKAQEEIARREREAAEAAARAEKEATKKNGDVLQAELAAEKAAEAVEAARVEAGRVAEAKPVIKGVYTTKAVGLRTVWHAKIVNLGDALRSYKKDPIVINAIEEALLKVAKRDAQAAKDPSKAPKGVEFYSEKV